MRERGGLRTARWVRVAVVAMMSAVMSLGLAATQAQPAHALTPAEFLSRYVADAQAGEREHGVPTSVALAQAALESGWGESSLTKEGNAFFGIKCSADNGPYSTYCVEKQTTECDASGCFPVIAEFRGYDSHADSFRDHGHFLRSRSRYANAFNYTNNPDQFIREIHAAGYATDPDYSTKIISLMQRYNMYQYNLGGGQTPSRPTIRQGDTGSAVSDAQRLLNAKGNYGLDVDGIFGAATTTATKDFQSRNGLTADGIIGPNTWAALDA